MLSHCFHYIVLLIDLWCIEKTLVFQGVRKGCLNTPQDMYVQHPYCASMRTPIMPSHAFTCLHMPSHAFTCLHMPSHAFTCLHMPSHAFTCLHMPSHAFTCLHMPSHAFTCLHMPSHAFTCLHMPSHAFTCLHMPSHAFKTYTLYPSHAYIRYQIKCKTILLDRFS
jgi:hypothetical protein